MTAHALRTSGRHRVERAPHHYLGAALLALATTSVVVLGAWLLADRPWEPAAGPASAGAPAAEDRRTVTLGDDGAVRVELELAWASARDHLAVAVPVRRGFRPTVTVADPMTGEPATYGPGSAVRIPLAERTTRAVLGYTARGTYVASAPSTPGRGLVLLTPLRVVRPALPVRLTVTDARILNVACTSPRDTRVCGTRDGSTWTVTDVRPGEDVVAQVTLDASA